jgi:hypothetical protein
VIKDINHNTQISIQYLYKTAMTTIDSSIPTSITNQDQEEPLTSQIVDIELADDKKGPTASPNQDQEEHFTSQIVDIELADGDEGPPTASSTQQEGSEEESSEEELLQRKRNCYKKGAIAAILAAFVAFVIADSLTNGWIIDGINSFL